MVTSRTMLRSSLGAVTLLLSIVVGIRMTESIIEGRPSAAAVQASGKRVQVPRVFNREQEHELPWTYAETMQQDYQENEAEANRKYRWNMYSVVCDVDSVERTDADEPFVTCKTKNPEAPVYLHFDKKWMPELQQLKSGDKMVAVGRPNGMTLGITHVECVQFRWTDNSKS